MTDADLVATFAERRAKRLASTWDAWAPANPNASDLHDCGTRYQVLRILAWQVRETPDAAGLERIEQGRVMESHMIRQLEDEGWEVVEQQGPVEHWSPVEENGRRVKVLSGRMDGKIRVDGKLYPFDTKDTSEWVFNGVDTADDLRRSPWTRKWWRQMQVYMLGDNVDRSFLILGFRGSRKIIPVPLDYEEAERLLQEAERAVVLVDRLRQANAQPDRVDEALLAEGIGYHDSFPTCRMCPFFRRACFPPEPAEVAAQARPDLADAVARYVELKPLGAELERLKKRIKKETEGYPRTVAGQHVVEGAVATRNMKAQPARGAYVQEFWAFDVHHVGEREKVA